MLESNKKVSVGGRWDTLNDGDGGGAPTTRGHGERARLRVTEAGCWCWCCWSLESGRLGADLPQRQRGNGAFDSPPLPPSPSIARARGQQPLWRQVCAPVLPEAGAPSRTHRGGGGDTVRYKVPATLLRHLTDQRPTLFSSSAPRETLTQRFFLYSLHTADWGCFGHRHRCCEKLHRINKGH